MKILVTPTSLREDSPLEAMRILREYTDDLVFNPYGRPLSEEELLPLLEECDGYIAGLDWITGKALAGARRLKVISRYGVGYDRVDIQEAKKRNITVTNTPGVNSRAVAELTFGLILSLVRKIPWLNEKTGSGEWVRYSGAELGGKTLGVVGLGAIGKIVAQYGKSFGMTVLAYDSYIDKEYCKREDIEVSGLFPLLERADVISLHVPMVAETHHLINEDAFARMKPGAFLVNTARGGLIDENAAIRALESGKLRGLGLDAFEQEPPQESPLFGRDDVVLTPHAGAHTKEAVEKMALLSVENLIQVLEKKPCKYVL
ncbi:MAG: phosphoglycerate dehydrogenase [Lachnospiraceae bacterium]|nr:phosphoglycerate dehydrogenase [Lachnospiraceae bacterium]